LYLFDKYKILCHSCACIQIPFPQTKLTARSSKRTASSSQQIAALGSAGGLECAVGSEKSELVAEGAIGGPLPTPKKRKINSGMHDQKNKFDKAIKAAALTKWINVTSFLITFLITFNLLFVSVL
jgi:hypothetical protein